MAKTTFTPAAAKRIVKAVKTVEQQNPGLYGAEGPPNKPKECVMYRNDSSDSVPMGGIVWLYEKEASGLYVGKKPDGSALAFYGVAGAYNPVGGIGSVFVSGVHRVLVTPAVYNAYTSSAYLGKQFTYPNTAVWEARYASGLMLVLGKDSESPYFKVNLRGGATGTTGAAGTDGLDGDDFLWIEAATKAELAAALEPGMAHTTGAAKRYYWAHGSSWDAADFLE